MEGLGFDIAAIIPGKIDGKKVSLDDGQPVFLHLYITSIPSTLATMLINSLNKLWRCLGKRLTDIYI